MGAEPETAKTEEQAKVRMNMEQPEVWRVVNPNVKSPSGISGGNDVMGGDNAMSLLGPEDYPQKRAGFTDYHVWVTPYRENERYAAGDYPMQSKGGDGLPAWTKANRAIENTDIVLWYTIAFTMPRTRRIGRCCRPSGTNSNCGRSISSHTIRRWICRNRDIAPKQNAPDSFESRDVCRSALPQVLLNQKTNLKPQIGK